MLKATNAKHWHDRGLLSPNAIGGPREPINVLKRFKGTLAAAGLAE
jgi:hypothetical protein